MNGEPLQVNQPEQTDYLLYRQALAGMQQFPWTDAQRANAAIVLATAAATEGLTEINHVVRHSDGDHVIGIQGQPGTPFSRIATINANEVLAHPADDTSRRFAEMTKRLKEAQQLAEERYGHYLDIRAERIQQRQEAHAEASDARSGVIKPHQR